MSKPLLDLRRNSLPMLQVQRWGRRRAILFMILLVIVLLARLLSRLAEFRLLSIRDLRLRTPAISMLGSSMRSLHAWRSRSTSITRTSVTLMECDSRISRLTRELLGTLP